MFLMTELSVERTQARTNLKCKESSASNGNWEKKKKLHVPVWEELIVGLGLTEVSVSDVGDGEVVTTFTAGKNVDTTWQLCF